MSEKEKHREHSLKIGLRCAEALACKWPTLHLDGYDIDEAARIIASRVPSCMTEMDLWFEKSPSGVGGIDPPRDPSQSIGNRLRRALGVEDDVSVFKAIELAIERLTNGG